MSNVELERLNHASHLRELAKDLKEGGYEETAKDLIAAAEIIENQAAEITGLKWKITGLKSMIKGIREKADSILKLYEEPK